MQMRVLTGKKISPGLADGHAVLYASSINADNPSGQTIEDVTTELVRFQRAVQSAKADLEALQHRVHREFGASEAEIFSAHRLMLNDPELMDDIHQRIQDKQISAEDAIQQSIAMFARRLQEADDPYLREREEDIRDIGLRLIRHIHDHTTARFSTLREHAIIVASELMPSDLVELDHQHLAGIVTERCGETSHVAILARALGAPVLSGLPDITSQVENGQRLLLDSNSGELVIEPSFVKLQNFRQHRDSFQQQARQALEDAELPCQTADGTTISILANLARPTDDELQAAAKLNGVGLLRTEFLFLDHTEPPTIDEQVALYTKVAAQTGGEATIRTLDLGGDKFPLFLERHLEQNPNMGSRGLRFSLTAGEQLFRDQIQSLLLTAQQASIKIMFPMVIGVDDLIAAKAIVEEIARNMQMASLPPLGVLIETPSSMLLIDAILEQVDFIGIGTNDLTQFILATDRNALDNTDDYSTLHPSVLSAINTVILAAHRSGIPVKICGEAASVPAIACLFVGMGVRRLSMSPLSAPRVKYALRATHLDRLKQIAKEALAAHTKADVVSAMHSLNEMLPDFQLLNKS